MTYPLIETDLQVINKLNDVIDKWLNRDKNTKKSKLKISSRRKSLGIIYNLEVVKKTESYIQGIVIKNKRVIELSLTEFMLDKLPNIGDLDKLEILRCEFNQLRTISGIERLTELRELHLHYNKFSNFPDISEMKKLEVLSIHSNNLSQIPEYIGDLNNLQVLNLSYNNIDKLPDSIGNLKNLKLLNICMNDITEIPESLGNLQLEYLYMDNNNLTNIPNTLKNMKQLKILTLFGNEMHLDESLEEWIKTINEVYL